MGVDVKEEEFERGENLRCESAREIILKTGELLSLLSRGGITPRNTHTGKQEEIRNF